MIKFVRLAYNWNNGIVEKWSIGFKKRGLKAYILH